MAHKGRCSLIYLDTLGSVTGSNSKYCYPESSLKFDFETGFSSLNDEVELYEHCCPLSCSSPDPLMIKQMIILATGENLRFIID